MLFLLLHGLIIGIIISIPVGPIAILCIQRSLQGGLRIGLLTGLGASLADGFYALVALLGLGAIFSFVISQQFWIKLAGGIFLSLFGIKLLIFPPRELTMSLRYNRSFVSVTGSAFLLTLANPTTMLAFVAIFAGLGLNIIASKDLLHALILVLGVASGSAIWWTVLVTIVALVLHHRLSPTTMRLINWISGLSILIFGILVIAILITQV